MLYVGTRVVDSIEHYKAWRPKEQKKCEIGAESKIYIILTSSRELLHSFLYASKLERDNSDVLLSQVC